MKKTLLALVALWAAFVSGCGTVCNLASGDLLPYGGLKRDADLMAKQHVSPPSSTGDAKAVVAALVLPGVFWGTEASLSFVGDVITLPLTTFFHPIDPADSYYNYNSVDGHDDEGNVPDGPHKVEPVLLIQHEPNPSGETAEPKP